MTSKGQFTFTFDFSDPESREDLDTMLKGQNWKWAVDDIDDYLRNDEKYNDKLDEKVLDYIEKLRDRIRDILAERGLKLE